VPEPSALLAALSGAGVLACFARLRQIRRRHNRQIP